MNNDQSMGRRRALQVLGTASGLLMFAGCNKGGGGAGGSAGPAGAAAGKALSCQDKGEIDEAAANLRKVLQYKEKSDSAAKRCIDCVQYEAGKYGDCGGCKLFAGGVHPEGVCLSFAPKQAPAAAPPAAPEAAPAKAG
jgi:hypothetical protein